MFPYPFDVSGIITRRQLDLEHLFQANNQLIYLGQSWPTAAFLALQIENRLYCCINDLSEIVTEINKWPSEVQFCGFVGMSLSAHEAEYEGAGHGTAEPLKDKSRREYLEVLHKLTVQEAMELANLEHTRQWLVSSWHFVEGKKAQIIKQAKTRIDQQGGAGK